MSKFDPSSMPDTTSPTVRALRTFVETFIENEIDRAEKQHGEDVAKIIEDIVRSVVFAIFHKNPDVHSVATGDMYAFDNSIHELFGIYETSTTTPNEV